ncbi:MAG: hypothetical protein V4591_12305 [Bdellovibrionota bacterium]
MKKISSTASKVAALVVATTVLTNAMEPMVRGMSQNGISHSFHFTQQMNKKSYCNGKMNKLTPSDDLTLLNSQPTKGKSPTTIEALIKKREKELGIIPQHILMEKSIILKRAQDNGQISSKMRILSPDSTLKEAIWVVKNESLPFLEMINKKLFGNKAEQKDVVIKLAPSNILEERINRVLESPYFLEKTQLHKILGNSEKYPLDIKIAVELAICDYGQALSKSGIPERMVEMTIATISQHKEDIIKVIAESQSETKTWIFSTTTPPSSQE